MHLCSTSCNSSSLKEDLANRMTACDTFHCKDWFKFLKKNCIGPLNGVVNVITFKLIVISCTQQSHICWHQPSIFCQSAHTHTYTLTKRFPIRFLCCNVQKDALLSKALTVSYRKVLDYKMICSSGIYAHLPILMFSHNQQITRQQCNAQIPSDTVQKLFSVFTSYIRMEEK